ncbi:hypothetical protein O181_041992 [Austropuccinia psidii MF-1]|uniref:Uncharacterized protein n=1 Tax=Austropuccinia psidii MF-1 TaxID=1389203 RepID=A0A9Q3DLW4_9BASI|nr:hypothetical protein [Austropuccinia psidii MF-1]
MSFENVKYPVDKYPYEWCLGQYKRLKAIDPQMKIQMRNHKLLKHMPGELEHGIKCGCNQSCIIDDIANTLQDVRKRKNIGKYSSYKSSSSKDTAFQGGNQRKTQRKSGRSDQEEKLLSQLWVSRPLC